MRNELDPVHEAVAQRLMARLQGFAKGLDPDEATTRDIVETVPADMPTRTDDARLMEVRKRMPAASGQGLPKRNCPPRRTGRAEVRLVNPTAWSERGCKAGGNPRVRQRPAGDAVRSTVADKKPLPKAIAHERCRSKSILDRKAQPSGQPPGPNSGHDRRTEASPIFGHPSGPGAIPIGSRMPSGTAKPANRPENQPRTDRSIAAVCRWSWNVCILQRSRRSRYGKRAD